MYKLYDYYEGKTLVAESDNWADIKKVKKEYIENTDGECDLEIEQDGIQKVLLLKFLQILIA